MRCAVCSTVNPENARFCLNCGAALPAGCPRCGTATQPGARFCSNCGFALTAAPVAPDTTQTISPVQRHMPGGLRDKLETARAGRAMEGERRIVTILFSDIRGSTALAEQMDPEEWAEIMNGAFECLITPIYRYEGTVARLMGDAILAFFGAPIAHEDDPRRAVLAGLDIIESIRAYRQQLDPRLGEVFDVRVGINTGLVVVGQIGSDLAVEYTAMGDAVNLASRMEQTASPGTVQIAANTYRSVKELFDVESLGGIEVKGKSEPVEAYRVLGERLGVLPKRGIEGLSSPLVGRDRELAALQEAVGDLTRGTGVVAAVMGEAGLGKSRLIAEVRAAQPADSPLRWLEGRSFSYETSSPFTPFISMLSREFGIDALHGDVLRYSRLKERIGALAPGREDEIAPFIGVMLSIAVPGVDGELVRHLEPPQLRGAIFTAVYQLFALMAQQEPLALVFEDLHWADDSSLELLQSLLPLTDEAAVMILTLFRPHREEPSWRFREAASRDFPHRYREIPLQPLDESNARQLVANLLEIEDLPEHVRLLILEKAEGNPFFVEEIIRSLLDAGLVVYEDGHWRATREIESLQVPDTLAGVITARLDRVPEEPRRVIQAAAVVGRQFQHDILADVYEEPTTLSPSLSDLQRRELILERRRLPERLYSFKHGLTQETAYASILHSKRRDLHRRVAECLEQQAPDRVAEIARHFLEAREQQRALPYIVEAGERARRSGSVDTAIDWFRQAVRIEPAGQDSDLGRRSYEGLGKSLELKGDIPSVMSTYDKMYDVGNARGDIPMMVSALNKRAFVRAMMFGDMTQALAELDEAEHLGRQARDTRGLVEMAVLRCGACLPSGNFSAAIDSLGNSAEVARDTGIKEELAEALVHSAQTLAYMTRFDDAWKTAQEAMGLARELDDLLLQAELLGGTYVFEHLRRGDLDAAREFGRQAVELSRRVGSVMYLAISTLTLGSVEAARGDYGSALQHLDESIRYMSVLGPYGSIFIPMARTVWGTIALGIGREYFERTMADHVGAIGEAEQFAGAAAWADLGFLALRSGDVDRAAELFERGLTVPSSFWLLERPRLLVGAALVRLARGDIDGANERIAEATAYAEERGMRHVQPLIALAEGQVALATGDLSTALESFQSAADLARQMRMRPLAIEALEGEAQVLLQLNRADDAGTRRVEARGLRDEMRNEMIDPELHAAFDAAREVAAHG